MNLLKTAKQLLLTIIVLLTCSFNGQAQSYNIDQIVYSHTTENKRFQFQPLEDELYFLVDRIWIYYTDEASAQTNVSYFIKKVETKLNNENTQSLIIRTKDNKQIYWFSDREETFLYYYIKRSDGVWKVTYYLTQTS